MTPEQRKKIDSLRNNQEELEKCKNDPVYFYNTYVKKAEDTDLGQAQAELIHAMIKAQREGKQMMIVKRRFVRDFPLTLKEAYAKLPNAYKKIG